MFVKACATLALAVAFCSGLTRGAPSPARQWSDKGDGFASVDALGQKGTTGGAGGPTVTVDNLADLEKYAASPEPHVILIKGTIVKEPFGKDIKVSSNKTLVGLGTDATILHGELHLVNVANVIIRNLTIRDSWVPDDPHGKKFDHDAIQIDNSHHIWIDHCNLTHMEDGLIDFRKESDYLTVSWCILSHHNKAFGIGWNPNTGKLHVTIHHTWIHDTTQRNPSLDNGTGHLYNNYLQNIGSYGNYSRGKSKVVVENSVFEKVHDPLICDADAEMVSRGNLVQHCTTTDEAKSKPKGEAFDPHKFYDYTLDEAAQVPDLLQTYAGPQPAVGALYTAAAPVIQPAGAPAVARPSVTALAAMPPVATRPDPANAVIKTVNADGTGDFKIIQTAIDAVPERNKQPYIIQIAPGRYEERVLIPRGRDFLTLRGLGADRTRVVITGGADKNAVLKVSASDFRAQNFTVENTAGQVGPQQALYGDGKRQVFENLLIQGWQDTLGSWNGHQAYFHNCDIWGSVDFIYSGGTALFDRCAITQRRATGGPLTAPSTPQDVPYGLVFLNCRLVKGPGVQPNSSSLMRPWREYGASAFINCAMDDHIHARGWDAWDGREATCRAVEYGSTTLDGKPIDLAQRAPWVKRLTTEEAASYTIEKVLGGWNPND